MWGTLGNLGCRSPVCANTSTNTCQYQCCCPPMRSGQPCATYSQKAAAVGWSAALVGRACSQQRQHHSQHLQGKATGRTGRQQCSASAQVAADMPAQAAQRSPSATLLCTSITATTVEGALAEMEEAVAVGADIVELRLDYLEEFNIETDLEQLLRGSPLPKIVTFRPAWEGGRYLGDEAPRLAALKFAALLGAEYIDVEYLASDVFFAGKGAVPVSTKVILSHHDYDKTPEDATMDTLVSEMFKSGADVAKLATTATDIADSMRVLQVLSRSKGPTIALAMGERGLPTRLLAPKFGGHLTFGALSAGRESAPGQPTVQQLRQMFRLQDQTAETKVYGIIGNPVSHSRSPAIHNAAMAAAGLDSLYIPLLVDDMATCLDAFSGADFGGFSVTIPHKLAALERADSVDEVAQQIGAVNTLVRQPDGSLKGYNTDWSAAIEAIEDGLRPCTSGGMGGQEGGASPLAGLRVVVLGAGGAGRALAFGAAQRGASVVIANRNRARAEELAASMSSGAEVADLDDIASGAVFGYVLANTTAVGMHPDDDQTPVPQAALRRYRLVFDAVYTPMQTRLLKEAEAEGCVVVSGLEMFVGQAAQQFELFTGQAAPVELMRQVVSDSLQQH